MQIRQFLEFLCLKSESNSPTLLLESQMHLNETNATKFSCIYSLLSW